MNYEPGTFLGIRNYVVCKIMALSGDKDTMKREGQLLARLNLLLVQILKQDWPHAWPSFIHDIVESSKTGETICENNMKILRLLSEEIFDFSKDTMVSSKANRMKENLTNEFQQVFELCSMILTASVSSSLLEATLVTLQGFTTWIAPNYIFESQLIPDLLSKLSVPTLRTAALGCLTEIVSKTESIDSQGNPTSFNDKYRHILSELLVVFTQNLGVIIPLQTDLRKEYDNYSEHDSLFINRLGLFISAFLTSHLKTLETVESGKVKNALVDAHFYLLMISCVDDEEVFKNCLDYWHFYSKDLYLEQTQSSINASLVNPGARQMLGGFLPQHHAGSERIQMYERVLHQLRIVVIDKMVKPEEVIIVEDENGEIVREMTKDTEIIAQYKQMRDTIVYLTNLNHEDSEQIMLEKLDLQLEPGKFTWDGLNTLCWAIGSISGAMTENDEKRFLVSVIKDLLKLCEDQRGKFNKAVVASNIMYIVGQYPRFLKAHWKFLKTVANKLFEFMHELHPGVQDMACDTFLKIAQKCKRKFMTIQNDENQPFIITLICDLGKHIKDLQSHQIQSFYESVACMLSDKGPAINVCREEVIIKLMEIPNAHWSSTMNEGVNNMNYLRQMEIMKEISRILKINNRVCTAVGTLYVHQLSIIFLDMLNLYRFYSGQINEAIVKEGEIAVKYTVYKAMRGIKSDILELLITFLEQQRCQEATSRQDLMSKIIPNVMEEVLEDYRRSSAAARDSGVLNLFAVATVVLNVDMAPQIPSILASIFEPTLQMISKNMLDYPEHRIYFFKFLRVANEHCFEALFGTQPEVVKLIIDSIIWALKHTERNISETGLEILLELLHNFAMKPEASQSFYQQYLLMLIQEIFSVMTDRLHKSGFRLQATLLMHILHSVALGKVCVPLFDSSSEPAGTNNVNFLKDFLSNILSNAFPNVTKADINVFVVNLFDTSTGIEGYKQYVRDFLITCKEFATEDNKDLYLEEHEACAAMVAEEQEQYRRSVPGLGIIDDPDL